MLNLYTHDILMWIAIIGLVILVTRTGMYINRFFIYRAHRKALAELHRRAIKSEPKPETGHHPETVNVRT